MAADRSWKKRGHVTGRRPEARGIPIEEAVRLETEAYLEMLVEDLVAEGWDPAEAR